MSLSYLPLPIFVPMTIAVAAVLVYYTKVGWNNEPKTISIGYLIVALGSVASGLIRIGENVSFIRNDSSIAPLLTGTFTIMGVILLVIGLYKKQNDVHRKKAMLKVILIMGLVLAICAIGIYILMQLKRLNAQ